MTTVQYDTFLGSYGETVLENALLDNPIELIQRYSSSTLAFLQKHDRTIQQGESNAITFYLGGHDSVRSRVNPLGDFHAPEKARTARLNLKFQPGDNPDQNDVRTYNAVARINQIDMDEVMNGHVQEVDFSERFIGQAVADLENRLSFDFHSDKSGALGEIATGGVKDEALSFDEASTYTNGSTTATIKIKGMAKGRFPRDMLIDIYDGDTLSADALRIVRVAEGGAIVVSITSSSTVSNLDLVDAGDKVYKIEAKDTGLPGALNEVVKESYSPGESWFRLDRTKSENMHYVPEVRLRAGLSEEMANLSHLTDISNEIEGKYGGGLSNEDQPNYKASMGLGIKQTLLREADGQSIRVVEGDTNDGSFRTGRSKAVHHTSTVGEIELVGDTFALNDRITLLPSDAIKIGETARSGMNIYTTSIGGMFERVSTGRSDGAGGKEWKFEADKHMSLIPTRVIDTATVFNLTP